MYSRLFVLFLVLLLNIACSQNRIENISIIAQSSTQDVLQVFISEEFAGNYTEENSKIQQINGTDTLSFDIAEYSSLRSIRIDLGDTAGEREFKICGVVFRKKDLEKVVYGDSLQFFFESNDQVLFDQEKGCFVLKNPVVHDPYIVSKNLTKVF
ncbi:MAG: hypothetical protein Q4F57_00200 [Weeksellaceae bacterium]|nr:hypothetical protein [Weeksellaceae bacterium]